jgi:hypothetical protein
MKCDWTVDELATQWTLLSADLALLVNKSGPTRLGFAVLLKFFENEARFPHYRDEVPLTVVAYLARQVGIPQNSIASMTGRAAPSSIIGPRSARTAAFGKPPAKICRTLPPGSASRCPLTITTRNR